MSDDKRTLIPGTVDWEAARADRAEAERDAARAELKARNDLLKNIRPVVALVENKLSTPPRVVREWIAQIDAFIMEDKT